jgi:hypothetical protein
MPDRSGITVSFLTPLFFRYFLPLIAAEICVVELKGWGGGGGVFKYRQKNRAIYPPNFELKKF